MSDEKVSSSTTRRYSLAQKEQAVRLVQQLREETGEHHGAVVRVARQLGFGVESVRKWVVQSEIDGGQRPGTTTEENAKIRRLEQEIRELRRANAILKSASAFFAAELDRPPK
jgi:transposase-like protein